MTYRITPRRTALTLVALLVLVGCSATDETATTTQSSPDPVADQQADADADTGADADTAEPTSTAADESSGQDVADDASADVEDVPVPTTPEAVCDLLDTTIVGDALGVTIDGTEPQDFGAPACSYAFEHEEFGSTNVVVAFQDIGFDDAVEANQAFAEGATQTDVTGIGDRALWIAGDVQSIMIVADGQATFTLAGLPLDQQGAEALARVIADRV